ncbi:MAG: Sec-independent protein translocase subunit TatA/TatB [Armatimonadota bacterium]
MMFPFALVGVQELWPIAIIVLVLFGAKRLPEMARSMGQGIKEFKKGLREVDDDSDAEDKESSKKQTASDSDVKS